MTAGVAWLAASIALVALFPREQVVEASGITQSAPAPIETLAPDQLAEWEKWLDSQPRVDDAGPASPSEVRLIKFNDYQCPSCQQTWLLYKDIIAKYEASHPDAFRYDSRDFPLESECGAGGATARPASWPSPSAWRPTRARRRRPRKRSSRRSR